MLTGRLKKIGARVEAIPSCEFEGSPANSPTEWACREPAVYRVLFDGGDVLHACEAHVEQLWDREDED
jgi:hypothetical protein